MTDLSYETVAADIARRDAFDQGREHNPLVEAPDAILVDTTGKSIEAVIDEVLGRLS